MLPINPLTLDCQLACFFPRGVVMTLFSHLVPLSHSLHAKMRRSRTFFGLFAAGSFQLAACSLPALAIYYCRLAAHCFQPNLLPICCATKFVVCSFRIVVVVQLISAFPSKRQLILQFSAFSFQFSVCRLKFAFLQPCWPDLLAQVIHANATRQLFSARLRIRFWIRFQFVALALALSLALAVGLTRMAGTGILSGRSKSAINQSAFGHDGQILL